MSSASSTGNWGLWRSPTVRVVLASTLVMPLGVRLVSPVLPLVAETFDLSDARTSLLVSAYFLPGVVLSPAVGALADRFGRRSVLVPSLLLYGIAGSAIGFVGRFPSVVGLRFVQGTGAAGVFVVTVTLVADAFEGSRRSAVLGINGAILFAGGAVYPLVGGALGDIGWNVPFYLYALAVPVGLFALVEPEAPGGRVGALESGLDRAALSELPLRRAVLLYGAAVAAEAMTFGALLTALPFLLATSYRTGPVGIGTIVAASTIASALASAANGRLSRQYSGGGLVAAGFVAYGVGLFGVWAARDPVVVGIAATIFGGGPGLIVPSVDDSLADVVPRRYVARALSVRNSATFLGRATGPLLYTGIAAISGYRPIVLASGVVSLVVGVTALAASRR